MSFPNLPLEVWTLLTFGVSCFIGALSANLDLDRGMTAYLEKKHPFFLSPVLVLVFLFRGFLRETALIFGWVALPVLAVFSLAVVYSAFATGDPAPSPVFAFLAFLGINVFGFWIARRIYEKYFE